MHWLEDSGRIPLLSHSAWSSRMKQSVLKDKHWSSFLSLQVCSKPPCLSPSCQTVLISVSVLQLWDNSTSSDALTMPMQNWSSQSACYTPLGSCVSLYTTAFFVLHGQQGTVQSVTRHVDFVLNLKYIISSRWVQHSNGGLRGSVLKRLAEWKCEVYLAFHSVWMLAKSLQSPCGQI